MILPYSATEIYRIADRDIRNIGYIQEEIRLQIRAASSLSTTLFLAARELFGTKSLDMINLYNKQLYNVSSLNSVLPRAISISNNELRNLEKQIDELYSSLVKKANESAILDEGIITTRADITNLRLQENSAAAIYDMARRKSNLERRLIKHKQNFELIKDYLTNAPREISILETQHKLLQNSTSRCEFVFQKSRHIECVLSGCINGIKSISSKQELLQRLGVAFIDIEEYVTNITDYTANEILNAASDLFESSLSIGLSAENSLQQIEVLSVLEEIE